MEVFYSAWSQRWGLQKMLSKFQRLPLKWRILLGVQIVVTCGIMVHRVRLIEEKKRSDAERAAAAVKRA